MSYILDALKRAESERERGVVPGLHSQSVPLRRPSAGSRAVAKPLMLACAALGLALICVLAWRSLGSAAISSSPTLASQGLAAAATPLVSPTTANSATSATSATSSSAATIAVPPPAPLARTVVVEQGSKQAALTAVTKPELRPTPKSQPVTAVEPARAPGTTPIMPLKPIMPISELPADVRQALPKAVISGSTYSDNQALRMLIINGEVFREGEKPAPDLQLEQIRAKSAVLNFKGLRYSVPY